MLLGRATRLILFFLQEYVFTPYAPNGRAVHGAEGAPIIPVATERNTVARDHVN